MAKTEKKAIASEKPEAIAKQKKVFVAVNPFHDELNPGKVIRPGDDVSHFSQERLQSAINRGLVKEG